MAATNTTSERLAYSIEEFCQVASVGRTLTFAELKAGRLRGTKVGRRTLILADDARAWLASLRSSSEKNAA
ncbi:hypothetical protein ACCD06_15675 [Azospirillum sp. CT11-132]|uniref:hypothetical protein n=1 Tax=Azospirillum sp. CT11-132 TaxID=3396317 RepID=UPI0039A5248E